MAYVPSQDPFTLRMQNAAAQGDSGSGYAGSVDPYQQWGNESWQLVSGRPGDPTIYLARQRPGGGSEDYMKVELALGPDGQYQATGKVEDYKEGTTWDSMKGIVGVLGAAGMSGLLNGFGTPTGGATPSGGLLGGEAMTGDALSNIGWGSEVANTGGLGYGGVAGGAWSTPGLTTAAGAFGQALPSVTNIADVYNGASPNYLQTPSSPPSGTTPSGTTPPPPATPPSNPGGLLPPGVTDFLKGNPWLLPLLGGVGGYLDAKNQPDRMNTAPQNVQDVLNNQMMNPPKSPWMRY